MKKILLTLSLGAIGMVSAFAQPAYETKPADRTFKTADTDYVTIGARMPYYVEPDAGLKALVTAGAMDPSIYLWRVTDDAAVPADLAVGILDYAGAAAEKYDAKGATDPAGIYYKNLISFNIDGTFTAGKKYYLNVQEKANLKPTIDKLDIEGCDGGEKQKPVIVLNRPIVKFDAKKDNVTDEDGMRMDCIDVATYDTNNDGAMDATYNAEIPITTTGLGNWEISYTWTNQAGDAQPVGTDINPTTNAEIATDDAGVVTESDKAKDNILSIPVTKYGTYTITLTKITDRISRKSLVDITSDKTDDLPTGTFTLVVAPQPVTSDIEHVDNSTH